MAIHAGDANFSFSGIKKVLILAGLTNISHNSEKNEGIDTFSSTNCNNCLEAF
jgi:hypothetical protein